MKYCVFDLETTGKETYKRFCNPLDPNHYVNILSYARNGSEPGIYYNEFNYKSGILPCDIVEQLHLDDVDILVGQNIKFDLLWIWGEPKLQEWLQKGGEVWDTRTVEYFLRGQYIDKTDSRQGLSLDNLALKYGGTLKDDRLKTDFYSKGITSSDIPLDIILPYALNDAKNTELVFRGQLKEVSRLKMGKFIRTQMLHYIATIEMEYNGLYVKQDTLEEDRQKLVDKQDIIVSKLNKEVVNLWPEVLGEFNPGSVDHVSSLLFGGTIIASVRKELLNEDGNPVIFKSGVRRGEIKTKLSKEEVRVKGLALSTFLIPKNKKGFYEVDEATLSKFKNNRIIEYILEYRRLNKLIGTYYYKLDSKGNKKGLLSLIMPHTGCIHPEYNTAQTITGRLSSSNPNAQNIPAEMRYIFTSRYPNGKIIALDYSQLEVIVQAFLTQSDAFINDIKKGVDFHVKRLAYSVDKPYEEVLALCNSSPEWKLKRKAAKTVSFQKAYGAQPEKISESTGLSVEVVQKIFDKEDEEYTEVKEFYEMLAEEVKLGSVPRTSLINIKDKQYGTYFTRPNEYDYISVWRELTGKLYTFQQRAVLTKRGDIFRYYKMPDIQNYPVQGFAATIVSTMVGYVYRYLLQHKDKAVLITEVHDEVVIDCREEYAETIKNECQKILADVPRVFNEIYGLNFNVPIEAEGKIGETWAETK